MQNPLDLLFLVAKFFCCQSLLNVYMERVGSSLYRTLLPCKFMEGLILTQIRPSLVQACWEAGMADTESCVPNYSDGHKARTSTSGSCEDRETLHGSWREMTMTLWGPTMPLCSSAIPGLGLPPSSPIATTILAAGGMLGLQHGSRDQTPHQSVDCRVDWVLAVLLVGVRRLLHDAAELN